MSAYWAIFSARFRMMLQYRAAAAAGLATQIVFGLIYVTVYQAFYGASEHAQPMTLEQVVTYVWLGQAFLAITPWNTDPEIQAMIDSGTVGYELCRPVDLYSVWFVRALAWRTAPTLLRGVPLATLALLFLDMKAPASPASATAFAVAIVGAVLLSSAITTLMNISLMWTIAGRGINRMMTSVIVLFSGLGIPLPLLPAWARDVIYALPFRGIVDIPFRLYTGHIPPGQAPAMLAHQVGWLAVLVLAGRWLLTRGQRRLVVQGG